MWTKRNGFRPASIDGTTSTWAVRHGLIFVCVALGLGSSGSFLRVAEAAEPLEDRFGLRIQPIFLLARVDVQTDLKLTPDQIAGAIRVGTELHQKARLLRGKAGPAVNQERRRIDEELTRWLGSNLTAGQLDRLQAIDYQWEGAAAMVRPIVEDYLRLTAEQKQIVRQYLAESTAQRTRGGWTAIDHFRLTHKAVSVLTDQQKELWANLLGEPCKFSIEGQKQAAQDPRSPLRADTRPQASR